MILEKGKKYKNITDGSFVELLDFDENTVQVLSYRDFEEYVKPRYVFYQLYREIEILKKK